MSTQAHISTMDLKTAKKKLNEINHPDQMGKPDPQMVKWLEERIKFLSAKAVNKIPTFGKRR